MKTSTLHANFRTAHFLPLREGAMLTLDSPVLCAWVVLSLFTANRREYLHRGQTFTAEQTLFPTTGNGLYSNEGRRLASIVQDTYGRHDMLLNAIPDNESELRNTLAEGARKYALSSEALLNSVSIFRKVDIDLAGRLTTDLSAPDQGAIFVLRAHEALTVALLPIPLDRLMGDCVVRVSYQF